MEKQNAEMETFAFFNVPVLINRDTFIFNSIYHIFYLYLNYSVWTPGKRKLIGKYPKIHRKI